MVFFRRDRKRFQGYRRGIYRKLYGVAKRRYAPGGRINIGRIAKDVAAVKGMLNVERKYVDHTTTGINAPVAGAWTVVRLNGIVQGDGVSQRNGAQIRCKSLQLRGRVKRSDTALSTVKQERVRMMVFIDKEPLVAGAGSLPLAQDLLTSINVDSLRNWSGIQERRFKVLMDRTIKVDQDDGERLTQFYKRLNMKTTWLPNSALGPDINNNALYVAYFTDSPSAVATERPQISYSYRLTYIDN